MEKPISFKQAPNQLGLDFISNKFKPGSEDTRQQKHRHLFIMDSILFHNLVIKSDTFPVLSPFDSIVSLSILVNHNNFCNSNSLRQGNKYNGRH